MNEKFHSFNLLARFDVQILMNVNLNRVKTMDDVQMKSIHIDAPARRVMKAHIAKQVDCSNSKLTHDLILSSCCSDINECASNPCQNGGSCLDRVNRYMCRCIPGYVGDRCETGETTVEKCPSSFIHALYTGTYGPYNLPWGLRGENKTLRGIIRLSYVYIILFTTTQICLHKKNVVVSYYPHFI